MRQTLKEYIDNQVSHCEHHRKNPEYNVDKYAKGSTMTPEQMSGYYQGRLEADLSILQHFEKDITN